MLELPPIRGLLAIRQTVIDGVIICHMVADDAEADVDLLRAVAVIEDPIESRLLLRKLKPNRITKALSCAIVNNRCGSCGGNAFRREFRATGTPRRLVDMLYCLGCKVSMRISKEGVCEGLSPSPFSHHIARSVTNRFKEVWGPAGIDEEYGAR